MSNQPTPDRILQLGLAFWGSKAFLSAVELGVFTELAQGPRRLDDLRRTLGLHERSARDFFDALVALGMLNREGDAYSNTAESALFLDRSKPSYVGGILEMSNARLYPFWGRLTEALKSGKPQSESGNAPDQFATLYSDPGRLRQFLEAMTGVSLGAGRAIAAQFPWSKHRSFYDLGCAQGGVTVQIALAHAHLTGGGFDLPVVRPIFEEYTARFSLQGRLKFAGGDLFGDAWPRADVYVLGHILHDWSLERKKQILRKAYESLPPGGAVIIHEAVIDDDRRHNAFGLLMSLNMLIETKDGFDFTGADCRGWMREAGFKESYVEPLAGPDSMVVAIK